MRDYRIVPTADKKEVVLEITGKDPSALFLNAAKTLENLIVAKKVIKRVQIRNINLQAKDISELLFRFLSDLIFLKDTYQLIFSDFEITVGRELSSLSGKLKGEQIELKRHDIKTNIRGISRKRYAVKKIAGQWVATVTLEI
jgi:SHS2 domain-containing protein